MLNDTSELKRFWTNEFMKNGEKFCWLKFTSQYKKHKDNNKLNALFWFWWRLANHMFISGNGAARKTARKIQRQLMCTYNIEVMLGANIGLNPFIQHFAGVVISDRVVAGDNLNIKQGVTIGVKSTNASEIQKIIIGDNVSIGANACIISDDIEIGHNVIIGALSLVNKSIPDNSVYYRKSEVMMLSRE
ncbi:putative acetyltransferase [Shimwellia blattae DSM 4481 = NBRC 105725]|nr:putative acetyltransferase [Shimwellia blattae DSM 4481 = NBRC 105725]